MAGTDFSHLTNDELIKGIQALKLPDYIRSKAYGIDVRETLAQMTEMTIQLGVNMGLSPDDALAWVKKIQDIDAQLAQSANELSKKPSRSETGWASLDILTEEERAILLGQEPGEINAVLGDGNVIERNIGDNQVTARKIEHLEDNINLFDKSKRVVGVTLNANGVEVPNATYDTSDYIQVETGTYSATTSRFIVVYDEDKVVQDYIDIAPASENTFNVVADGYVRFVFFSTRNRPDKAMLVRGSSLPSEYQPYYFEVKEKIKITDKNVKGKLTENVMKFLSNKNLFDPERVTEIAVLNVGNGTVAVGGDLSDNYGVSHFIPIKHGFVELTRVRNYVLYDKERNYLTGVDSPEEERVEIEQDGFIRVTFFISSLHSTMITNNELLGDYQEYGRYYLDPSIRVTENNLSSVEEIRSKKVSIHFGDSISANGGIIRLVEERTGYDCYNFAVGGTRLIDLDNIVNPYQKLNFLDLLKAKVSGNWDKINEGLSEITDQSVITRIEEFKTFNMTNVDYLTFMYGTNDIVTPTISIGDEDSTDTLTINGALNEVLTMIGTNWSHIKVYAIAPIIRAKFTSHQGTSDDYVLNGVTIFDYVNRMESKAKEYKVPFKNMLQESGINALNSEEFLSDGIHPNSKGDELIAEAYSKFLLSH